MRLPLRVRLAFCVLVIAGLCTACSNPVTGRAPTATPPLPTLAVSPLPPTATPSPTLEPATATPTIPAPTNTSTPTFTPTPEPPWRFVVFGDTRTAGFDPPAAMFTFVELARAAQPDVVLAVGDMIKALDSPDDIREQWRRWQAAVAPLAPPDAANRPWLLVTPGNHDVEGSAAATELLVEAFPALPSNGPPGFERRTYSVDYRGVRFISLDSETFGAPHRLGEAQLEWLEARLRDNPNQYTIVFSHDPAFPVGPHIGSALDAYPAERDRLWALLKEYRATAYMCGHEHLYNRRLVDGIPQIVVGTSGSYVYTGFGGEFQHILVAEVGMQGIVMIVYDSNGIERDRFIVGNR